MFLTKIELAGEENRQKMSVGLGVYGDASILFIKHWINMYIVWLIALVFSWFCFYNNLVPHRNQGDDICAARLTEAAWSKN